MKNRLNRKKLFVSFAVFALISVVLMETFKYGIVNASESAYQSMNTTLPLLQKAFDASDKESENFNPRLVKNIADKLAEMSKDYDSGLASSFSIMAYSLTDDDTSRKESFMDSVNNLPDSELPMFLYATRSYWEPKAYEQEVSARINHGMEGDIGHTLISLTDEELQTIRDCRDTLPQVGSYESMFKTALHGLDIKFYSCKS